MADQKISQLTSATTPLAGTELVPLVQSGTTKKVAASALGAGAVAAHEAAADPHPQYLTSTEGNAAYATAAQGALAATAVQPGDPTLSDAREWTASTISQAEAEAGSATTRRAFTAQRVRQAIAAWWQTASTAAGRALAEAADAAAQRTALALSSTDAPQFARLGLGVAAATGIELAIGGATVSKRDTLTVSGSTYTWDVTSSNEAVTGAAIAGNTTINLSELDKIPSGYVWRGVLRFSYTSGTISWFTGNSTYTVKWDGGSAMTPTSSDVEAVVIEVVGGGTTIEVAALRGRA